MEYTFTITEEELGVIASALVEMPYKTVAPLFDKLNQQVAGQRQAAEAPPAGRSWKRGVGSRRGWLK